MAAIAPATSPCQLGAIGVDMVAPDDTPWINQHTRIHERWLGLAGRLLQYRARTAYAVQEGPRPPSTIRSQHARLLAIYQLNNRGQHSTRDLYNNMIIK